MSAELKTVFGDQGFIGRDKSKVSFDDTFKDKKLIGIYFSAHWCPPCRKFTPVLADFYNEVIKEEDFIIVFVSSDKDEASFHEYLASMPWVALPLKDPHGPQLKSKFGVRGIPTFVIIDSQGEVIATDARGAVESRGPSAFKTWKTKARA